MWLYLYFIKRWLIKEAKINLDWYSLGFSLETLQHEPTIFCILICFSINFMPPQSQWPFTRFTRQIPGCLGTSLPLSQPRAQGSSRKELRCPSGVGWASRGGAAGGSPLCPCACTSLFQQTEGSHSSQDSAALVGWKQTQTKPFFTRADECNVHWKPLSLFMFESSYPPSSLPILYCSPCAVRNYILAQIYTGTDIKALTQEAQCNRLFLLDCSKGPWFILSLPTGRKENMEAKTTWVPSKTGTAFTQVSVQKQCFRHYFYDYYFIIEVPLALHRAEASQVLQQLPRHLVSQTGLPRMAGSRRNSTLKLDWMIKKLHRNKIPIGILAWPFPQGIGHLSIHCWPEMEEAVGHFGPEFVSFPLHLRTF